MATILSPSSFSSTFLTDWSGFDFPLQPSSTVFCRLPSSVSSRHVISHLPFCSIFDRTIKYAFMPLTSLGEAPFHCWVLRLLSKSITRAHALKSVRCRKLVILPLSLSLSPSLLSFFLSRLCLAAFVQGSFL